MAFDLHKTIAQLRSRLRDLGEKRDFIEAQLVEANIALRSLAPLIEDPDEREEVFREIKAARRKPAGLTEAISNCLRATPHQSLRASEVREWLEREGFDLSDYSQPLATISVALRRLAERELVEATHENRNVTYRWIAD